MISFYMQYDIFSGSNVQESVKLVAMAQSSV